MPSCPLDPLPSIIPGSLHPPSWVHTGVLSRSPSYLVIDNMRAHTHTHTLNSRMKVIFLQDFKGVTISIHDCSAFQMPHPFTSSFFSPLNCKHQGSKLPPGHIRYAVLGFTELRALRAQSLWRHEARKADKCSDVTSLKCLPVFCPHPAGAVP